jgi:hypothetical protein
MPSIELYKALGLAFPGRMKPCFSQSMFKSKVCFQYVLSMFSVCLRAKQVVLVTSGCSTKENKQTVCVCVFFFGGGYYQILTATKGLQDTVLPLKRQTLPSWG